MEAVTPVAPQEGGRWGQDLLDMFSSRGIHPPAVELYSKMFRTGTRLDRSAAERLIGWFDRGMMFPAVHIDAMPDWVTEERFDRAHQLGFRLHWVVAVTDSWGVSGELRGRLFDAAGARMEEMLSLLYLRNVDLDAGRLGSCSDSQLRSFCVLVGDGWDADDALAAVQVV